MLSQTPSLQSIIGRAFTSSHKNWSLNPFKAFGFFSSPINDSVSITTKGEGKEKVVEFSYNTGDKKDTVSFLYSFMEASFAKPKVLADGQFGIHCGQTAVMDPFLSSTSQHFHLLAITLFCGDGRGSYHVDLVFDKTNRLDKIHLSKSYKGKNTELFVAHHLKSDLEIAQQRNVLREQQEVKKTQQQAESETNRFNF